MAVISVTERLEGPGSWTLSEGKVLHRYTRTFEVITDNVTTSRYAVLSNKNLPVLGTQYNTGAESDSYAHCVGLTAERQGKSLGWTVTAEYDTIDPLFNNINPIDNNPKVSWDFTQFEEVANYDLDGNAILNTADDPFDPPVTRDFSRPVLKIVRNELTFNYGWAWLYRDCLNARPWIGADVGCVKVSNISATIAYDPTVGVYWVVEYGFAIDERNWKKKVLNAGFRQLGTGGGGATVREMILVDNQPATFPVLLDDSGHAIPPGTADLTTAVELAIDLYPLIDFDVVFGFQNVDFGLGIGKFFTPPSPASPNPGW